MKKTVILGLCFVLFAGCKDPEAGQYFLLPPAEGTQSASYVVNVLTYENGSVIANHATARAGAAVILIVNPNPGYRLKNDTLKVIQTDGSNEVTVNGTGNFRVFEMPAYGVTVNAEFEAFVYTGALYNVNINTLTGSFGGIELNHISPVAAGSPVVVTVKPNPGYRPVTGSFSIVKEDDGTQILTGPPVIINVNHYYSFLMPASVITINIEFEIIPPSTISIIFDGFLEENLDLTQSADEIRRGTDFIEVTVTNAFDKYYWYHNDFFVSWNTGNSYTLYPPGHAQIGIHSITVVAVKDGIPYSNSVLFKVN